MVRSSLLICNFLSHRNIPVGELEQPFGWTWGSLVFFHEVVLHSSHPLLTDMILQLEDVVGCIATGQAFSRSIAVCRY